MESQSGVICCHFGLMRVGIGWQVFYIRQAVGGPGCSVQVSAYFVAHSFPPIVYWVSGGNFLSPKDLSRSARQ
jgi:hypothetical protein